MIVRVKKLFLIFGILFLWVNSNAQVEIADALFDNFEFHQAIKFYEKEADLNNESLTKYAFCQLQIHNYQKAEELYQKVVKIENTDAINFYYYGVCLKNNKKYEAVVLDIPLLLENKLNKKDDILIFVQPKKSEIIKRLKKRDNFNISLFNKFKKIQLPLSFKKKKSNYIIKNNFTNRSVKKSIKKIIKEII